MSTISIESARKIQKNLPLKIKLWSAIELLLNKIIFK